MKLSTTQAQNSFKYGWLLSKIWPYIKPYTVRILWGFIVAIPLGLLDCVKAFAEGQLVELGIHEDLRNIEDGQYKHFYKMQFRHQEV